ncbi:MAG: polysaccharide deacetylase family protein [Eubacteriales bacterium]|nr:polysaccharide deacetylase family protein [Eubacteriales bacterium]
MDRREKAKTAAGLLLIFTLAFCLGGVLGQTVQQRDRAVAALPASRDWGLSFREEGKLPEANATIEELARYNAYYAERTEEKTLYLTFDCGYENGNTPAILDALKKHGAPAAFFVVGNYLETSPELVKRMLAEGHTIGNHSYHHPDMSRMGREEFQRELAELETLYRQITGREMEKYYRPPQGKYSEENLRIANELGYKTFFWSLAYVDWNQDAQPSHEEAFSKLTGRVHPGAVVLLHNTSRTNGEILDELLMRWEKMGYRFKAISELTGEGR